MPLTPVVAPRRRTRLVAGLVCIAQLASPLALATTSKEECASTHDDAQRLRLRGKLRAARADLLICASQECPQTVSTECVPWLEEVERSLPTVVFGARLSDGTDLLDVAVWVDGEKVADALDGRAVPVDPGPHVIRFVPSAASKVSPIERRILVSEGEKARAIRVDFPPPPVAIAPPSSASSNPLPWETYVFGGASVLSLGAFGYFALTGLSGQHDLNDCSPMCSPARIDPVHRDYVASDVFLGVGLVSAAVAVVFAITSRSSSSAAPAPASDATSAPTSAFTFRASTAAY